jgi:hypothetical protein
MSTEPMYLVWSNDTGSWWGPGGHGYRGADLWRAGRFTRAEAIANCSLRTWPSGARKTPPEVPVPAPENGGATFTVDQVRGTPRVMAALIDKITLEAMNERDRERKACRWCRSGGEPGRKCSCSYRCGYGGCCSQGVSARHVFDYLIEQDQRETAAWPGSAMAKMSGRGPDHSEVTITPAGRDEAAHRGLAGTSSPSAADGDQDG